MNLDSSSTPTPAPIAQIVITLFVDGRRKLQVQGEQATKFVLCGLLESAMDSISRSEQRQPSAILPVNGVIRH